MPFREIQPKRHFEGFQISDPSRTTMIIFYVPKAVHVLIYYLSGTD
jgi:hypothetical protein